MNSLQVQLSSKNTTAVKQDTSATAKTEQTAQMNPFASSSSSSSCCGCVIVLVVIAIVVMMVMTKKKGGEEK